MSALIAVLKAEGTGAQQAAIDRRRVVHTGMRKLEKA
jgi:hypothetical protein